MRTLQNAPQNPLTNAVPNPLRNWGMFWLLGLVWGSSFLLIKIAVAPIGANAAAIGLFDPLSLAAMRLIVGSISFIVLLTLLRRKLPTDPRTLFLLAVAGLTNNAIPYMLITWGEQSIDSGLASVLNATTPLFSLIVAHLALADDKITMRKIFSLVAGFAGVILLATRSIDPTHPNPLLGQLAIVGAAASYAFAAVFMRRTLRHVEAITTAAVSITAGALIMIVILLVGVRPLPVLSAIQPGALVAVVILGVLNTAIAYVFYFMLMSTWGASRTTMVTYVTPPFGLLLGIIFQHEPFDWKLGIGSLLIVGGVALPNLLRRSVPPAATSAIMTPAPIPAPIIAVSDGGTPVANK